MMNMRWWLGGVSARCFRLARNIRGRSHEVRTRRGIERASMAVNRLILVQPANHVVSSQTKLVAATDRLWARATGQIHFAGVAQIVGITIAVARINFSIVTGLGSVVGRSHGCVQLLLKGRDLRLLHRRRMRGEVLGPPRSLRSPFVGFRGTVR